MSEEVDENEAREEGGQGQIQLERMYLKDASFESPNSPGVFQEDWQPAIDLQLNTRSQQMGPGTFEIVLTVTITVRQGEKTAFIVEVQQAGLFRIEGLPEAVVHRTLGTFCPNMLFPYVREAVDSLAVRGGFPPLNLVPINFDVAYEEAMRQAQEGADATTH